ncbi:MAG: hypothetical protein BAA01_01970 [Bacillus thermozeamaize]|uniref:PadR family transcriptional regulator n=1 Tax=Bacillus thermozeamaize TaxID=230954 RepID=A0A1Y3PP87_9BACI|nr:MAG: hypothetical protein BAA01_01970 [Bacillus thermozeamaize]
MQLVERELLILGLLKAQDQHGYKINEFIEKNLGRVTNMKKATAYAILKRLEKEGYVESTLGKEGNRPVKIVYSITMKGEKRFEELLRELLASTDETTHAEEISIMFLDHLSVQDALACLTVRLKKIERMIDTYRNLPKHHNGLGVNLAISRRIRLCEANRDWLKETIEWLKKQTETDESLNP